MMKQLVVLLLVVAVGLAVGCSSIQTISEQKPDVDFSDYKTWDWYPGDPEKTGDPRIDLEPQTRELIMAAVEARLAERGYKRSGFSPQLYVDYHVSLQDQSNSQVVTNYSGEDYYPDFDLNLPGTQDTYGTSWESGSLMLLIFDATNKELVWRGRASTDVNTQGPRKEAREKLEKVVEELVNKVPKTE